LSLYWERETRFCDFDNTDNKWSNIYRFKKKASNLNMVNKFRLVTDHQRPLLTSYTYSFWSYYILHARSAIFSQDKALIYVVSVGTISQIKYLYQSLKISRPPYHYFCTICFNIVVNISEKRLLYCISYTHAAILGNQ
jgi:hypothetical protein